jgi:hypothetical protein
MITGVLALAMLGAAVPAGAEEVYVERPIGPPERPFMLGGNIGMGSAVGNLGLTLGYQPSRRSEIEVGIGRGYTGLQVSLMPKALLGPGALRLMLGAGPSYSTTGSDSQIWLNAELGLALIGRHLFGSLAAGVTYLALGSVPAPCFLCDTTDRRYYDAPRAFPTTRATFGVRF